MKAITGVAKTVFLGFFCSHILATAFIDIQAIMPDTWIPQALQDVLIWYITSTNDPLMGNAKHLLWFQSLICLELLIQLPFFFWACAMLLKKKQQTYPESFRYGCIAYVGHSATSMIPILVTLATSEAATITERMMLFAIYLPYLIFPLALLQYAILDGGSGGGDTKKNS